MQELRAKEQIRGPHRAYELLGAIASGGMGTGHLAWALGPTSFEPLVAVKVLPRLPFRPLVAALAALLLGGAALLAVAGSRQAEPAPVKPPAARHRALEVPTAAQVGAGPKAGEPAQAKPSTPLETPQAPPVVPGPTPAGAAVPPPELPARSPAPAKATGERPRRPKSMRPRPDRPDPLPPSTLYRPLVP